MNKNFFSFLFGIFFFKNPNVESVLWKEKDINVPFEKVHFELLSVSEKVNLDIFLATCFVEFSEKFDNYNHWNYKVFFIKDYDNKEEIFGYYHLYTHPNMIYSKFISQFLYLNSTILPHKQTRHSLPARRHSNPKMESCSWIVYSMNESWERGTKFSSNQRKGSMPVKIMVVNITDVLWRFLCLTISLQNWPKLTYLIECVLVTES